MRYKYMFWKLQGSNPKSLNFSHRIELFKLVTSLKLVTYPIYHYSVTYISLTEEEHLLLTLALPPHLTLRGPK